MKILLTSAGFNNSKVGEKFIELLDKPVKDTKVLFIPTAAISDEAQYYVGKCKTELLEYGINEVNIRTYDFEYKMTEDEALSYDVIYFTGGTTSHLLTCVKKNGFDSIIKTMVMNDKIYVGVSAGSIIMTINISLDNPHSTDTSGLGYLPAFLAVHCNKLDEDWFKEMQAKLPLQFIALNDMQAILVKKDGYMIIE